MAGSVVRDVQALPITTAVNQGAGEVQASGTALDGANQIPFVLLLDEANPARLCSPAGDDTLHNVLGALTAGDAATLSSVPVSITSVPLLAAADGRRGLQIVNDSTVATLYLAYGSTASTALYTAKVSPGAQWEMPGIPSLYTGPVAGIWDVADSGGAARITELSGTMGLSLAFGADLAALYGNFPNTNVGHAPRIVATPTVQTGAPAYRCALYDDRFLFVPCAGGSTNVEVWDLTCPTAPARVSTIALPLQSGTGNQNPVACACVGHWLVVAAGSYGQVFTYDVTNPGAPVVAAGWPLSGTPLDLVVVGRDVIVAELVAGPDIRLWYLDSQQLPGPGITSGTLASHTNYGYGGGAGRLAAIPQHGYVATTVSGVSEGIWFNATLALGDTWLFTDPAFNAPGPIAHFGGEYLAVGNTGNSTLVIVDCANWASPHVAATLVLAGTLQGIAAAGRYLYVTSANGTLYVVDVSNPSAPLLATTVAVGGSPQTPVAMGRYVVLGPTNGTTQFSVLDMTSMTMAGVSVDAAEVGQLRVRGDASVASMLSAGALVAGRGGLVADGPIVGQLARGVRQVVPSAVTADVALTSGYQNTTSAAAADWGIVASSPVTTTGGDLLVRVSATLYNNMATTGNWTKLGISLDGGSVKALGYVTTATAASYYPAPLAGEVWLRSPTVGAHTVSLVYQNGGPTGANPATSIYCVSQPSSAGFSFTVTEFV